MGNIHCSSHINQAGYFIVEGNQVCQAPFALGESMLAFPDGVFDLTCDSLQEDSFHMLPRD